MATAIKLRVLKIFLYISYVKIRHHLHCASSPFQRDHCLNIPKSSQHDGNTTWVIACSVSYFSKKNLRRTFYVKFFFYPRDHNLNRFESTLSHGAFIQLLAFLTNWFLRRFLRKKISTICWSILDYSPLKLSGYLILTNLIPLEPFILPSLVEVIRCLKKQS